jgi:hypothetical protein
MIEKKPIYYAVIVGFFVLLFSLPQSIFGATSIGKQNVIITVSSSIPYNHCVDAIQNYDETGVDCGGALCPACINHCLDGIKNYDETGVDCGGALCPACATGGGGGGGGGGGSVMPSRGIFIGKAAPNSIVYILRDGLLVSSATSSATGDFNQLINNITTGNHRFTIYYIDTAGRRSESYINTLNFTQQGQTITTSNILLSPTFDLNKQEVAPNGTILAYGFSVPGSTIILTVTNPSGVITNYQTTAGANGAYQFTVSTNNFSLGQYSIKVRSSYGTMNSEFTAAKFFNVGEKDIIVEDPRSGCPKKGDLNGDCRVNLIDFSIAAYWYKRDISLDFSFIEDNQLNGDNKINLTDFSILAYYWTG